MQSAGVRQVGFGTVVHRNVVDRFIGLLDGDEQWRSARQANASVDSIDEFCGVLGVGRSA